MSAPASAPPPGRTRRWLFATCVIGALALLPALGTIELDGALITWKSLLPASTALAAVVLSRRVVPSLVLGLCVGAIVAHGRDALVVGLERYFWVNVSDRWHLLIGAFALCTLAMVRVVEASGGATHLMGLLQRRLRTARSVKLGTAVSGLLVFFDDYANTFLVGASLRPLTDRYGVSREKLAYIVDSTAAPVAGLALVSTWLSYELGLLGEIVEPMGLGSSYGLLIQALPMRFYCIVALFLVFLSAAWERDMGPMLEAERLARIGSSGSFDGPDAHATFQVAKALLNSVLPIGTLVTAVLLGYVYDGTRTGEPLVPWSATSWQAVLSRAEHGDIVLSASAALALMVALSGAFMTRSLTFVTAGRAIATGLRQGLVPLSILYCAWGLGAVSKDLQTGPFLVSILHGTVPIALVALGSFLVAAIVAFATGTSWGTMAIVLPAAAPLAHQAGGLVLLVPTIAAVLDGAIFGDHCSPVSDTTLLSSTACDCEVLAHTATQLPYALLAMVASSVAYLLVGFEVSPGIALLAGMLIVTLGLGVFGRSVASVRSGPS